jgi:hypothetical protein
MKRLGVSRKRSDLTAKSAVGADRTAFHLNEDRQLPIRLKFTQRFGVTYAKVEVLGPYSGEEVRRKAKHRCLCDGANELPYLLQSRHRWLSPVPGYRDRGGGRGLLRTLYC